MVRPVEGRQSQDIRKLSLDDQLAALFAQEPLPEKKGRRSRLKRRSK